MRSVRDQLIGQVELAQVLRIYLWWRRDSVDGHKSLQQGLWVISQLVR